MLVDITNSLYLFREDSIITVWSHITINTMRYQYHHKFISSKRFQVTKRSNEEKFYEVCISIIQNCGMCERKMVNGIEFSVENAPRLYDPRPSIFLAVV